jgi:hypothetical protein
MLIRTSIDETGRLLPRRVDPQDAYVALTQLSARAQAVRTEIREPLKAAFDGLMAEVRALTTAIETLLPPDDAPPKVLPEPDPALLLVTTRDVLDVPRALNNFIDVAVRSFQDRVYGAAMGPATDPDTTAGRSLHDTIFAEGRSFLQLSNVHQWAAVKTRFAAPTTAAREALDQLGLMRVYTRIGALNDHFGRLIGVTEEQVDSTAVATDSSMSDFLGLAMRIVCFANLAWPGTESASVLQRVRLTEPYLGVVRRDAADHSRQIRASADSGETDNSTETTLPTDTFDDGTPT